MTTTTNAVVPAFNYGPFPVLDVAVHSATHFLQVADLAVCARVSKPWNVFIKGLPWAAFYNADKLPPIHNLGSDVTMEDYLVVSRLTVGPRQMAGLGEFVGEKIPSISKAAYLRLKKGNDPFEPSKKLYETFVIVIEPSEVLRRDYDKTLLDELVKNGDFDAQTAEKHHAEKTGFLIPYSLKNINILAKYPVTRKGTGPVVNKFDENVVKQCNAISTAVKVTIMRKEVPAATRNLNREGQNERVKQHRLEMVPLTTRLFYNVVTILNEGTCPDKKGEELSWTYAQTSDLIHKPGHVDESVVIGGYSEKFGLSILINSSAKSPDYGAAVRFPVDFEEKPTTHERSLTPLTDVKAKVPQGRPQPQGQPQGQRKNSSSDVEMKEVGEKSNEMKEEERQRLIDRDRGHDRGSRRPVLPQYGERLARPKGNSSVPNHTA